MYLKDKNSILHWKKKSQHKVGQLHGCKSALSSFTTGPEASTWLVSFLLRSKTVREKQKAFLSYTLSMLIKSRGKEGGKKGSNLNLSIYQ